MIRLRSILSRSHGLYTLMCAGVATMHLAIAIVSGMFIEYGLRTDRLFATIACAGSLGCAIAMAIACIFACTCREYLPAILIGSAVVVFSAIEFIYASTIVGTNPMVWIAMFGALIAIAYVIVFTWMIQQTREVEHQPL